ncbi:hypothetical protein BJX76DRAFT_355357 [Aspergillus varians]
MSKKTPNYPTAGAGPTESKPLLEADTPSPPAAVVSSVMGQKNSVTKPWSEDPANPDAIIRVPDEEVPPGVYTLVAEYDPIIRENMVKKLRESKYGAVGVANGRCCEEIYRFEISGKDTSRPFDVAFIGATLELLGGKEAAKAIRKAEMEEIGTTSFGANYPVRRCVLFVITGSQDEPNYSSYIEAGFDGWIPKPIDYERLPVLIECVYNTKARNENLYNPGGWHKGGWFKKKEN